MINYGTLRVISPGYRIYAPVNRGDISSVNGSSPIRRLAINWTNAGLLSVRLLEIFFVKFESEFYIHQNNTFEIVVCQNGGHFVKGEMS